MTRRTRPALAIGTAALALAVTAGLSVAGVPSGATAQAPAAPAAPAAAPHKVVIIVVDALSKEIVRKYGMTNVQALMRDGVDTPNSYLGHTGSVTVVTHNVITSGQLPKHMGWTDEGYRDVDNLFGTLGGFYITSDWTTQLLTLQQHAGYPKLDEYLETADPNAKSFVVSPKGYAAYAYGSNKTDSIVTFARGSDCASGGAWRKAGGINPPAYLVGTPCSRFYVHDGYPAYAYDTTKLPAVMYALDGDRYVTGHDAAHPGGDVWAADAALQIMRNEANWNGIFVTLPGVDKAAHMWGGVTDPGPTGRDGDKMTHMVAATQTADAQVGKIMAELKAQGILDDTLVVLTADHGSVAGRSFYGKTVAQKDYGYFNWYYGKVLNDTTDYNQPQDAILPLVNTGNVGLSYSDSMVRAWLKDQSSAEVSRAATAMASMPAVTAVWQRNGDHYDRVTPVQWGLMKTKGERDWFTAHAQELVDTEAADYGPDLIATLPDDTTYSVKGDHGGIQRATQQIPIVFAGAGLSSQDLTVPFRSVDIMPTILQAMGITPTHSMDGIAYTLPTN